jgi:hypothetical protein
MAKVKIAQLLILLIFFGSFVSSQDQDGVDQLQNSDGLQNFGCLNLLDFIRC